MIATLGKLALLGTAAATLVMGPCSDAPAVGWILAPVSPIDDVSLVRNGDVCVTRITPSSPPSFSAGAGAFIPTAQTAVAACDATDPQQWWRAATLENPSSAFELRDASPDGGGECLLTRGSQYSMDPNPIVGPCDEPAGTFQSKSQWTSRGTWTLNLTRGGELTNHFSACCGAIFETHPMCLRAEKNASAGADAYPCADARVAGLPFCDSALGASARAADLVSRLALEEKALQMDSFNPGVPRLAVPPATFAESLHTVTAGCGAPFEGDGGHASTGCPTIFPQVIALGASFDRALWRETARAIATEARALHNQRGTPWSASLNYWAPNVNPFRDPRWGRGQEVVSEDPWMNGEYARSYVPNLQGEPGDSGDSEGGAPSSERLKLVATAKHYYGCE